MPLVSVLMGVYNGRTEHVSVAIDSIIDQTFRDFEFIIIDDGSGGPIGDLLRHYEHRDTRIRLFRNERNIGLTRSLNIGLRAARGKYIARMDADDISLPQRLATQVEFMEANPDVAILGARFEELINGVLIPQRIRFFADSKEIRSALIDFNPFCHSTVILRRRIVVDVGGYDESYRYSQDYDLWLRLCARYECRNLDAVLVVRRMDNSISTNLEQQQRCFAIRARYAAVRRGDYGLAAHYYLLRYVVAYVLSSRGRKAVMSAVKWMKRR